MKYCLEGSAECGLCLRSSSPSLVLLLLRRSPRWSTGGKLARPRPSVSFLDGESTAVADLCHSTGMQSQVLGDQTGRATGKQAGHTPLQTEWGALLQYLLMNPLTKALMNPLTNPLMHPLMNPMALTRSASMTRL